MQKIKAILIIIFFLLLFIPLITFNFEQNRISKTENRTLANMPSFFDEQGKISFGRQRIESWIEDNIGFRDTFIFIGAVMQSELLCKVPSSTIQKGKDGFFFWTLDNNVDIAYGRYPLTEDVLEKIKNNQLHIYNTLKDLKIDYVLALPPSKSSIYPEKVYGNFTVRDTPVDLVANYLEAYTDIPVIRLKQPMLEEKENFLVHYKTDTHWTMNALNTAYNVILERFNKLGYINGAVPVTVPMTTSGFVTDMKRALPYGNFIPEEGPTLGFDFEALTNSNIQDKNWSLIEKIEKERGFFESASFINNSTEKKEVLTYNDSFFGTLMASLLSNNFSVVTSFWFAPSSYINFSEKMKLEDIKRISPDIVLFEITERYISSLANDFTFK